MNDSEKSLRYLVEAEKLAEEILADRKTMVFLDRRRNESREALRALKTSGEEKCWLAIGCGFAKSASSTGVRLIEDDLRRIEAEVERLRSELRLKVNTLRDLEYAPPVPGLDLAPLSRQESVAFLI